VAAAVRGELQALLRALPQLPETTLMDDTPTANPETHAWLAAEGLLADADDDGPAADAEDEDSTLGDGSEALDTALADDDATAENGGMGRPVRRAAGTGRGAGDPFPRALSELRQGRPNRAIELLVAELARERSPRGRFVRQTQIAYVMVESGFEAVAKPILERLISVVDERSLEEWESGPLVAQPIALLCRVIDRLDGDSDAREELYLRVCRLDPLQAIALRTT
jgi:type VI secretion system protein ImpA